MDKINWNAWYAKNSEFTPWGARRKKIKRKRNKGKPVRITKKNEKTNTLQSTSKM